MKEFQKLIDKQCWDMSKPLSKRMLKAEARREGNTCHVGFLHPLAFEKNAEMFDEKLRVPKGRVVFRGEDVRDQDNEKATFNEQSCSASMAQYLAFANFGLGPELDMHLSGLPIDMHIITLSQLFP